MWKSIKNLNKGEKILWFISVFMIIAGFILSGDFDWMTLISSLVGVTALIFLAKGDVIGQIILIIFSLLYAVVSYKFRYYGEMITYVGMSAPIAAIATYTWIKNPYGEKQVKISKLTSGKIIFLGVSSVVVTIIFYFILKKLGTSNLFFSSISVTTSFIAAGLTAMRSPYYAIGYACNDVVLIILWLLASLEDMSYIPMLICFVMFLVNDIYGFISWKRMQKNQNLP